jgi:putative intracellular protease/amidase
VAIAWFGRHRTNNAPSSQPESNAEAQAAASPKSTRLQLPRVLIIIPSRDFAYSESNTVRTQLIRFGVTCDIASTTLDDCQPFPQSSAAPAQPVKPDLLLANAKVTDYTAIYFCGGTGAEEYAKQGTSASQARRVIDEALAAHRIVAATGIGVVVLAEAGALRGREAACYPYGQPPLVYARRIEAGGALCSTQPVVEDGPFLTNRGPQDMAPFTRALLKRLGIEPRPPPSPAPDD